jgi:phage gp29-like protein
MATKKTAPANVIIQQVILSQTKRENLDINKWRTALRSAESITSPRRDALYDLYNDIMLDAHLAAVIQKRKTSVLNSMVQFVRDGDVDEDINIQIDSPWFRRFISDLIDTIFWGHSVFQFYKEADWITYDLIPRKHINPVNGMFLKAQTDTTGIPYRDGGFPNIIETGEAKDLGLLCKAAPHVIYKRNGMADYAQFAELFGQPLREGIYDGYDEVARQKLREDLETMGSSSVFIHPENTQIKLLESGDKSGNSTLFTDLIALCNAEISKLILGNTLTTDQGDKGTQALGTVHQDIEEQIKISDRRYVLDTLNYDLADIFATLGINTEGGEFVFVDKQQFNLTEKAAIDMQIASKIPIDDDYWYETYGIPKPDNYDELKAEMLETQSIASQQADPTKTNEPAKKKNPQSIAQPFKSGLTKKGFFSFFGEAPK